MEVTIRKTVETLQEAEGVIKAVADADIEKAYSCSCTLDISVFPKKERFGVTD